MGMNIKEYKEQYLAQLNMCKGIEVSFANKGKNAPFKRSIYFNELTIEQYETLIQYDRNSAVLNGIDLNNLSSEITVDSWKEYPVRPKDINKKKFSIMTYDLDFKDIDPNVVNWEPERRLEYAKKITSKIIESEIPISAIIFTGTGIHIQFFMNNPVNVKSPSEYKRAYNVIKKNLEIELFDNEYELDNMCSNVARLFRLPLTKNYKHEESGTAGALLFYDENAKSGDYIFKQIQENKDKIIVKDKTPKVKLPASSKSFMKWALCIKVKIGERNRICTFIIREALARRISNEEIIIVLKKFQNKYDSLDDPFSIEEVMTILEHQKRYHSENEFLPKADIKEGKINPYAMALIYIDYCKSKRIAYYKKNFYMYLGGYYQVQESEKMKLEILTFLQSNEQYHEHISKRFVDEILENIKALSFLRDDTTVNYEFEQCRDDRTTFLNLKNGILKISIQKNKLKHELLPHSEHYFMNHILEYDYVEDKLCEHFQRFLDSLFDEKEKEIQLQEMFALCLIRTSLFEVFYILIGKGGNGKGVIRILLGLMVGETNISNLPIDYLSMNKLFHLSMLEDKMVNFPTESENMTKLDVSTIKKLVSGETIPVEKKFKDPFDLESLATLIFSSNSFPELYDDSEGLWRRIKAILFNKSFKGSEKNLDLKDKNFWINSGEVSGILNWALVGLDRIVSNGQVSSLANEDEIKASLKNIENPLSQFFDDYLTEDSKGVESPSVIYDQYRHFCMNQGLGPMSQSKLTQKLKNHFNDVRQDQHPSFISEGVRVRKIYGVRLVVNSLSLLTTHTTQQKSIYSEGINES
jgi:putative DNA primase/helicase